MPRGDSVSRIMDTRKGTCEVRVLKNCYAPTAYRCIVTDDCNDRVLPASARVGMGMLVQWQHGLAGGPLNKKIRLGITHSINSRIGYFSVALLFRPREL